MIMKTTKLILASILLIGVMCTESAAVSLTAAGTALGWFFYEKSKYKKIWKEENL